MADLSRPRLPPIQTAHHRTASMNTVESDSSDSSPGPMDEDTDFIMHMNDSTSTIGALTAIRDGEMDIDVEHLHRTSPIQKLPPELLIHIFSKLTTTGDLRNSMLVCYHWALYTVNILWHRPLCSKWSNLLSVAKTLSNHRPSFPYHEMVKRLNLSGIADKVNDGTVQAFINCKAVERLTLTSCSKLTDLGVAGLVDGTKRLQALDVTDLEALTDRTMLRVAQHCPRLQGLNITNCAYITDESLLQIALNCTQLKRLKLNGVARVTDESVIAVAENCRSILEIDLQGCQAISSASVTALLSNLPHLRELRLAQCVGIDSHAFTDLKPGLRFDALRILDLTACDGVGDEAIARIIPAAPRLRNLVLAKCRHITDQAVRAICTLTKNLHYIHLGHCQLLTDNAVIELVQQCNRIRYIDLACCSRLTDASVRHLAKLPKLRRVGLVKCQNLTDTSIIALARGPYGSGAAKPGMPTQFVSLERVHLSYCTSLTLKGITQLLLNCPRLTHLSLTGVQAFLRDDLTRFCREAPTEFTHVQRDVFCVFSGDGVVRLRDYLARLALEQQERDQEQQNAVDEQVVGPDSPDADSLSDGTVDGNEHLQQMDLVFGPGRHGMPRMTSARTRQRPRSFHDLPHPNFHIEMPLLPNDQIQRMGPWTPGHMTPEMRTHLSPHQFQTPPLTGFEQYQGDFGQQRIPSPLPTPAILVPDSQPRSRSQSRRHTMDATDGGFFGYQTSSAYRSGESSSRMPFQRTPSRMEGEIFSSDHMMLPVFQTSMHSHGPIHTEQSQSASTNRPDYRRGNSQTLRPDLGFSSFDVNHEAILSTIPNNSRGPSRGPSRISSPHASRVQSRSSSRMGNFAANARPQPATSQSYADVPSASAATGSRSRDMSRQRSEIDEAMRHTLSADEQLQYELYGNRSSFRRLQGQTQAPLLPPGLMQHVVMAPGTPNTPVETPGAIRDEGRRHEQSDVDMTQ
ncbi:SCF ubiquitin ligase complex subunit [Knufia obscura]|uniref:SCF ubiquitin ligase complex subunit n=1 Tax=Knufia obscura TaxID=1635080 RepID=A0ABR0RC79_9EURO|nr:SCF ubiquitin ligase complex subunit [Knufia obscura]